MTQATEDGIKVEQPCALRWRKKRKSREDSDTCKYHKRRVGRWKDRRRKLADESQSLVLARGKVR